MSEKLNCWNFKNCGREEGGAKVDELGVCPTVKENSFNKYNGGSNGGRVCWAVSGTFCGGDIRGTFVDEQDSCVECDFFNMVKGEEGAKAFKLLKDG